jgi:hypothetical protein
VSYKVGKGKPPKRTQFRKGRSGNPKGRPKGSVNLASEISKELKQRVTVKEGGINKTIPKQTAVAKALVNKSMQGDMRAGSLVMAISERGSTDEAEGLPVSAEERALLRHYLPGIQRWLDENEES